MASSIIHIAVAKEVNKVIKKDYNQLILGSIAPDLSKLVGENKDRSHFLDSSETDIPNIDKFLNKYKTKLGDTFVLGYFIHLYTDYLWFKYFIPEVFNKENSMITKLDGTKVKCSDNMLCQYIYNDYTNLNLKLLEEYHLDLDFMYNNLPKIKHIIDEIPMDQIKILTDTTIKIIENTKTHKDFIFDITNVKTFISSSTELILAKLDELFKEGNYDSKSS